MNKAPPKAYLKAFLSKISHLQASDGKRGSKKQVKPSVRQRLAAKLLSGSAKDRTISDVDAVEHERMRDADSHRWVT